MEGLECKILKVADRHYRIPKVLYSESSEKQFAYEEEEEMLDIVTNVDQKDDEEFADPAIRKEGDAYVSQVSCDSEVFPFIIGRMGATRKTLEAETGAQVLVPRREEVDARSITLRGPSLRAVSSARTRVHLLITQALSNKKMDYTHFLSIPLVDPKIQAKVLEFRTKALAVPDAASLGLEESIFVTKQLHLTLSMLKLYSEDARAAAQQVVQQVLAGRIKAYLAGAPLRVRLAGLEYMNDDPSAIQVLYLKVHEEGAGARLKGLCDMVQKALGDAGLLLEQEPIKLHATLINTRYRAKASQTQARVPIDGRTILQEYGDWDAGTLTLQELHLSQRGKSDPSGYYHCVTKCSL